MSTLTATYAGNSWAVAAPFPLNVDWGEAGRLAEFLLAMLRDNSASSRYAGISAELARRMVEQSASATSTYWLETGQAVGALEQEALAQSVMTQRQKNQAAIRLLQEWLADESGYDEENWPIIKKAIEENRLSDRKRFDD
jgi:hypothetical protein